MSIGYLNYERITGGIAEDIGQIHPNGEETKREKSHPPRKNNCPINFMVIEPNYQ